MPDSEIRIRRATAADVDTIAGMVRELAAVTGDAHKVSSTSDDFLRHGFGERPAYLGLIARHDDHAVGMSLWFYNFSSWRGDLGAYLQDLYVSPALRGSGLGRRLLSATARMAMSDGATHLRLSVATANEGARAFYDHLGFTYRDDERIYQVSDAALEALAAVNGDNA